MELFLRRRRESLKKETESLSIATQNNATGIDYIKGKIDKALKNNKYKLYGVRY